MGVDPFDLPDELLDDVAIRLAGVEGVARQAIVGELCARHPEHATTLLALSEVLVAADRVVHRSLTPEPPLDPVHIGAYQVLRRLGEGAFGVVYLCAQERPVTRQVAVKVLRPGAGDRNTLVRFATERQVLVGFDHPGIAAMIDAGELADGRPYFAMEYVDGEPITVACDRDRLSLDARLRLFNELCDAVQHAHTRGVIHRDLKPGNVLVTRRDGRARPKVIDFGIAKAMHPMVGGDGAASATLTGRVIGTPGYMSPEQAAGCTHAVDARADVFSLGVMLYELLAGDLPWHVKTTSRPEPVRPSLRVQSTSARTTTIASQRALAPRTLALRLRGDLDWIVLKALSVEPERRYESARALADDIERHLRHETVSAGRPSVVYRLRKLAQRHRGAAAAGTLVLAATVVGCIVNLRSYRRAETNAADAEEARSRERDARGAAEVGFTSALGAVDALLTRVADLRLKNEPQAEALQRALFADALGFYRQLLRDHAGDARLQGEIARVRKRVVELHIDLGQLEEATKLANESITELEAILAKSSDAAEQRAVRRRLGNVCVLLGLANCDREESVARATLERGVQVFETAEREAYGVAADAQPDETAAATTGLANALFQLGSFLLSRGEHRNSAPLLQRAAEKLVTACALRPQDPGLRALAAQCDCALSMACVESSPAAESDAVFARLRSSVATLLEQRTACSDRELRRFMICLFALAIGRQKRSEHGSACLCFDAAIAMQRRLVERHPALPNERRVLAGLHRGRGHSSAKVDDTSGAEHALRTAMQLQTELIAEFPAQAIFRHELALSRSVYVNTLIEQSKTCALLGAEELARQAIADLRGIVDDAFPQRSAATRAFALGNLGHVLDALGRDSQPVWEEAVVAYRDYIARWPDIAFEHDNYSRAVGRLATHRLRAGDLDGVALLVEEVRANRAEHAAASVSSASRSNFARLLGLAAEAAAQRGDHAAAAGVAQELEPWLFDPRIRGMAADALFVAWQTAARTVPSETKLIEDYAERADALYEATIWEIRPDVVATSTAQRSVQTVNRWGQAHVRRAQILAAQGVHARAVALVREGLDRLREVRVDIYANWWSEAIYMEGHATLVHSHLALHEVDAAAAAARLLARVGDGNAEALFRAACLLCACADQRAVDAQLAAPVRDQQVATDVDAALEAVRRAVACGLQDRQQLAEPALARLRTCAAFAAIVAQLPLAKEGATTTR